MLYTRTRSLAAAAHTGQHQVVTSTMPIELVIQRATTRMAVPWHAGHPPAHEHTRTIDWGNHMTTNRAVKAAMRRSNLWTISWWSKRLVDSSSARRCACTDRRQ